MLLHLLGLSALTIANAPPTHTKKTSLAFRVHLITARHLDQKAFPIANSQKLALQTITMQAAAVSHAPQADSPQLDPCT
jgi:hypothetical protein